jgi:hypothetical protein
VTVNDLPSASSSKVLGSAAGNAADQSNSTINSLILFILIPA